MLFLCALLFLGLAAHPFTTYPASLALLRRFRKAVRPLANDQDRQPSFAILVPAYNEESVIVAKAENLLALQRTVDHCEILIYVDAASDRTVALLEPYRDRITVVVGEVRRGKSHGLNQLTRKTMADILVFTDANVMLDPHALRRIGAHFADPDVGCVCGHLKYGNGEESATAATGNLYWKIEERIRQLESDTIGIVGADGSLFATRRHLHPVVPPDIIDDFYVSMKILLGGHAVVRAPDALAYERTGSDGKEEFGRKVRIACQAFNVHRLLWDEIKAAPLGVFYAYVSHRLLKWLIIYDLAISGAFLVAGLSSLLSPAWVMLMVGGALGAFAVGWRLQLRPFPQLGSMMLSFAGVGWGVFRSLRGDRFQTWSPMGTARMRADAQR